MEIDYRGANSIVIKSKNGAVITDPTEDVAKPKELMNPESITIVTQTDFTPKEANFIIDMPGEYEKNNISIKGIPVQKYGEKEAKENTMYRIVVDGVRIAFVGHINSPIVDDDLESLGVVDVAVVPVSNNGSTMSAQEAANVVRQLDPKVIIPTHYSLGDESKDSIDAFIKELSSAVHESVDSLKIKNAQLPQVTTIYSIKKK